MKNIAKLQYITRGTTVDEVMNEAFDYLRGGGQWIQLRMKDVHLSERVDAAETLQAMCSDMQAQLIINDDASVAAHCGAGVHVGQHDTSPEQARELVGDAVVGVTANTFEQLQQAVRQGADYIGLGPFRYTSTKKNLSPTLGVEGYREIMNRCRAAGITTPVVAIGGITLADLPALMATGIHGVAVSGSIGASGDVEGTTREFLRTMHSIVEPENH